MIGVAGLSPLGIVTSAVAATRGFEVVAYDPDPERCAALERRDLDIDEPGLADLLDQAGQRLRFTCSADDLHRCSLIDVILDVAEQEPVLPTLRRLLESVFEAAPRFSSLLLTSQAPPSAVRRLLASIKQRPRPVDSLTIHHRVEAQTPGQTVAQVLRPERFLLGCESPRQDLPAPLATYLQAFDVPILKMHAEGEELSKLAINLYLLASLGTAGELSELCRLTGADAAEIETQLGQPVPKGKLAEAWTAHCQQRHDWVLRTLKTEVLAKSRDPLIAVWGLAPLPETPKVAPGLRLLRSLASHRLQIYDPNVFIESTAGAIEQAASAHAACRDADALVIMAPRAEFASIDVGALATDLAGRTILDPYGCLPHQDCVRHGLSHLRLGAPKAARESAA